MRGDDRRSRMQNLHCRIQPRYRILSPTVLLPHRIPALVTSRITSRICHQIKYHIPLISHGSAADTILVVVPIVIPADWMTNTIFACDNGCVIDLVGSVTFGSRRFNISLEINDAEILVIDSVPQLYFK